MLKPTEELKQIITKQEKIVAKVAADLFGELVKATPVGNPSLWKNPKSAPKGYAGGNLKASWTINKVGDTWIINNSAEYAEIRLSPYEERSNTGSKQFPAGIEPIVNRFERILQSELRKI